MSKITNNRLTSRGLFTRLAALAALPFVGRKTQTLHVAFKEDKAWCIVCKPAIGLWIGGSLMPDGKTVWDDFGTPLPDGCNPFVKLG